MEPTFIIHTVPSCADPARVIACTEVLTDGQRIDYADFSRLKQVIAACEAECPWWLPDPDSPSTVEPPTGDEA